MFSDPYLIIVILLFILAISDLVVGVSNDAVNFLNSAIGSKVATRRVIMIVASLGILIGSTFSSGMMEVARKGVFNPEFFYFGEIMIIFIAVMLTDIILLDLFNTIGLPTSTTVSIVFELLGASVMMAAIKLFNTDAGIYVMGDYINHSKALMIISGIFLSVVFAFLIGTAVQFISRMILSFKFREKGLLFGLIWCTLALSSMSYFLLFKGIRGTSFASENTIEWISTNMLQVIGISILVWLLLLYILHFLKVDMYRVVVLFGTFSLAMAFAGNDLVNFIGVPIAGFESYLAWSDSGQEAFSYSMEILKSPVRTQTYLLVISGLIMIVTLWFSKKARSVTETEVNLGRQSEGHERFTPNRLARSMVKMAVSSKKSLINRIPLSWRNHSALQLTDMAVPDPDKPAFDLVRAGVNLTAASVLIAFATSLKLPLSTTYVSFMVAMGTSLADQAWGRDSAVYRVAGVLNVIGGWFATAIIAFLVCALFALLIYNFNMVAIAALLVLAIVLIFRSFIYHKKKEKQKEKRKEFEARLEPITNEILLNRLKERIIELLDKLEHAYHVSLTGLIHEDHDRIKDAKKALKTLRTKNEDLQYELFKSIKRIQDKDMVGSRLLLYIYDLEMDALQTASLIVKATSNYVKNVHKPLKQDQIIQMELVASQIRNHHEQVKAYLRDPDAKKLEKVNELKRTALRSLELTLSKQIEGIKSDDFGAINSNILFKILLESKDLVAITTRLVKVYDRAGRDNQTGFMSFTDIPKSKN
ncbi:MAG: inorganic phosphate transporter [Flavobacteriaceae bacterium]|nr:inorganic phosphate transporter [Flavobacteriaceae bacterium]